MVKTPLDAWIAGKIGVPPGSLTREAIEDYQLDCLRRTVRLVKAQSAFYRSRLGAVEPEQIVSLSALAELPFTSAEDISRDPQAFVCVPQNQIERIVSLQSSGTTGRPKRIFFTGQDQELTIDFFDHGMRNLVGPGDRVQILLPWELPGSVGDLLRTALARMGVQPIPYGPVHDAAEAIEVAAAQGANAMVGIPTHVLGMARHPRGEALRGRVKSILLTTDHVPDAICRAIEGAWGCRVFNHYGMTEMGLGGGVQCPALAGYHVREADLYFEIVDPESGRPLREGEAGEVVFTTLTRRGMPLLRYRTGDLSRFIPGTCPCGSALRQMDIIRGRLSGRKRLAGQAFTLAELDEALFRVRGVLNYRCQLLDVEGQEALVVDVMGREGSAPGGAEDEVHGGAGDAAPGGVGEAVPGSGRGPAGNGLAGEVRSALCQVPAVAGALAGGRARVLVNVAEKLPVSRGTVKRTIADRREEARSRG